jgi:molybdenum cofactor cytidylyltransferase
MRNIDLVGGLRQSHGMTSVAAKLEPSDATRLFAVIPAAGHSRRMGRPKLLLPFQGTTIIGRLLAALEHPRIATSCVVVRADDVPLKQVAESHGCWVVSPDIDPPDMRASVVFALQQISERFHPSDDDGWLLIPADHPLLTSELLGELVTIWDQDLPEILVPTHQGKRGHPTMFRWSTVSALHEMPLDCGINWLLERFASGVQEWPCAFPEVTMDLDTPEDFESLQRYYASAKRR